MLGANMLMRVAASLVALCVMVTQSSADCLFDGDAYSKGALTCQVNEVMKCLDPEWQGQGVTCIPPAPAPPKTIKTISAWYRCANNPNNSCNATGNVAGLCDGKQSCSFVVDPIKTMCGDICPFIEKTVTVQYECASGTTVDPRPETKVKDFGTVALACAN